MKIAKSDHAPQPQGEAACYALLLGWGTQFGLVMLVLGFLAYLLGMLHPLVPLEQLPGLWSLPLADYLLRTGSPTGWGWLALVAKGDLLNLLGICVLVACSMPAVLVLTVMYMRRREHTYALICALIVMVMLLAASGIVTGGH